MDYLGGPLVITRVLIKAKQRSQMTEAERQRECDLKMALKMKEGSHKPQNTGEFLLGDSDGKEPTCQCRRCKRPGSGRSPREENGNSLQ